jgi:hypothetical protein
MCPTCGLPRQLSESGITSIFPNHCLSFSILHSVSVLAPVLSTLLMEIVTFPKSPSVSFRHNAENRRTHRRLRICRDLCSYMAGYI